MKPVFIKDIDGLRAAVLSLEGKQGKKADLWKMLKLSARAAPFDFPWYTPFVALITQEPQDVENAKSVLRSYVSKFEDMNFSSGIQYHFWCFSFPHAKWSMYFQWLCTLNAFEPEEEAHIREALIEYHFTNFLYGMRTKPEPECVDNQALSLAYSCAFVGYLFKDSSKMAEILYREGLRRLPDTLYNMPVSGYTGEGSTYMDYVIGPAIPFVIELLELSRHDSKSTGPKMGPVENPVAREEDSLLFAKQENGFAPIKVLEMVAREWMPGGLLLPWDNYGYQLGMRSAIAYALYKTGGALYKDILENRCRLPCEVGVGWAYDDLVWTLIWWSHDAPVTEAGNHGLSWFEPTIGGALVSSEADYYLMQMWDEAGTMPARCHVNPNAVILNGYKVPLSADGSPGEDKVCERFYFDDTWRSVNYLAIGGDVKYNYGNGCAGAHSVVLVDNWEGMRPFTEYRQHQASHGGPEYIFADVTPIYRERFTDTVQVARKSTLLCDRFFVIEDYAAFMEEHVVTARFLLRPGFVEGHTGPGVKIETPEGVTLHLFDLQAENEITTENIPNFPYKPDEGSVLADFSAKGKEVRRLFIAFISRTRKASEAITGFSCLQDRGLAYDEACIALDKNTDTVNLTAPPYMETDLPIGKGWWFKKTVEKRPGPCHIILPCGMKSPKLWLNDRPVDLEIFGPSLDLLQPHVPIPLELEQLEAITVVLKSDVPTDHFQGGSNGTVGLHGGAFLCYPCDEEQVKTAVFKDNRIRIRTNVRAYEAEYKLMEGVPA